MNGLSIKNFQSNGVGIVTQWGKRCRVFKTYRMDTSKSEPLFKLQCGRQWCVNTVSSRYERLPLGKIPKLEEAVVTQVLPGPCILFLFSRKKIYNFSMVLPCVSSHFNFLSFEIFKFLLPKMSLQILNFPTLGFPTKLQTLSFPISLWSMAHLTYCAFK